MRAFPAVPLLLSIAACGQSADPTAPDLSSESGAAPYTGAVYTCEAVVEPVDADFEADGLVAADALAALGGERVHSLRWDARGELTSVHLGIDEPRDLRHVWSADPDCPPYLLVDLTVVLATDDGRLDEVFDASVRYEGGASVQLLRWVALDQLVGSWEPAELDPDRHTAVDVEIVATLSAGDSAGELALYAVDDKGRTEVWDAARWPAP